MATAIQRRRGTAAQHSSFTGLAGEITIDTTNNTVVVHDGSTAGGHRLAKYAEITALGEGDITGIVAGAGLTGDATSGDATLAVGAGYGITVNANDIELTNASVRALFSAAGDLSYNSTSGAFSFTNDAGDIEGVTAGDGLSGGGTSGTVSLALDLNELTAATVAVASDSIAIIDADDNSSKKESIADLVAGMAGTGLTAASGQLSLTDTGFVSGVTAGAGLTGGGASGNVTVNAVAGTGITVNADSIETNDSEIDIHALSGYVANEHIDHSGVTLTAGTGLTGGGTIAASRTFNVVGGNGITANANDVAVDVAYFDVTASGTGWGANLEPSANNTYSLGSATNYWKDVYVGPGSLYVNGQKVIEDDSGTIQFSADNNQNISIVSQGSGDIEMTAGGDIQIKSDVIITTNKTITSSGGVKLGSNLNVNSNHINNVSNPVQAQDAASKAYVDAGGYFSVTDAGGDGSLSVSGNTFTYTGPSAAEVRAHISGGTGVTVSSGEIAIGQAVATSSDVQFADLTLTGNLTVSGTTTTVNTQTLTVADNIVLLNSGTSGAPSEDAGLQVDRGSSADVFLRWDETNDYWEFTRDGSAYHKIFTEAEIEAFFSVTDAGGDGSLAYSGGVFTYTGPSTAEVAAHLSVTDSGGDGSLAYNNSTGVFTYTGPSASEVRAHLSGGTGITFSGGAISVTAGSIGATELEATTVTAGVYGSTTNIPVVTVDADGRLTGASNSAVAISHLDTGDLSEGSNQYFTTARANTAVEAYLSGGTGITFSSGVISLTDTGYVTGVTAGTGLSGGGTEGTVTLNVSGLTVSELAAGSLQTSGESFSNDDTSLMTSAAIEDKILSYGYTTAVGDITGVTAGTGLSGGGSSGGVTLNLDMSELTDMTGAVDGSEDELILLDNGADRRKLISEIGLSAFSNDSGFTTNVGDITGVTAGTGLSGGGSSGSVTLNVSGLTVSEIAAGSLQTGGESFSDSDTVLMTAAAVQDKIESYGYSTTTGDITGVTAGTNLNGGGSSGAVTVNLDATLSGMTAATFSGTVTANLFDGTASSAQYADLAEKYTGPDSLQPGDVVVFGGEHEVDVCGQSDDHRVAGVISTEPAYMMNAGADGHYVALTGRVPCKVTGPVAKGDLLVTSDVEAHAKVNNDAKPGRIIGKAIGSSDGGEAVIEVLVNLQ